MKSSLRHPPTTLIIKHLVCCVHIIASLFFASCQSDAELHETRFTALSESETGISFTNTNKEDGDHNILLYEYFYNGGGVAAGDINNDGLTDLYFTSNQGENKLYINKGDLRFEDITRQAGVEARDGWKTGVTMVDINADGYLDIYVSKSGELPPSSRRNLLFINNKDLTFTEQAGKYGLDDNSYTTQTAFFDYDRDGDLDAFILNHSRLTISNSFDIGRRNSNQRVAYVGDKLYRNDGARFVDVSDSLGVFGPASNYGLGVGFADIDRDGWPDIYTSNDYTGKDKLLLNKKGKIFHEVSDSLFTHLSQFSMGIDIADVNNDGMDDVFTLDMLPETNKRQKELLWPNKYDVYSAMVKNGLHHQFMRNMLQLNNGDGTFTEVGQFAGVSNTDWSWAPLIADFDLDGLQDIFVSNGFKREFINNDFLKYKADLLIKVKRGQKFDKIEDIVEKMPSNKVHNYIYRNKDGITFHDESVAWGFGEENLTNGTTYADLDNDGDLDLVTNQLDQRSVIYRNNSADSDTQQFIKVRAIGNDGNTFGLGAVVNIYSKHKVMTRTLNPSRGFQSSVEPLLFFGLDSVKVVDSLTITWPRGEFQVIRNVQSNQLINLFQKDATFKSPPVKKIIPAYSRVDNAIPFQHRENDFVDFRVQPLLPRTYSASGPAVASADVNGDGRMDLYFGGAKDQQGVLLLQASDGKFVPRTVNDFSAARQAEEVDAVFFDMDNDGDKDLYVVTGGYEFPAGSPLLFDLLYANDGHGNFTPQTLPGASAHGSCVRPADVDRDGDLDLFIGGRISNGRYPEPVESFLFINDGSGKFMKSSAVIEGMVTDAAWLDVNSDQWPDLVVVGEWMPVKVMINNGGKLVDKSADFVDEQTDGWWNRIITADFDKDGDMDLVVGNFGMNNQFRPTIEHPATMRYGDFDGNGSVDPMMSYHIVDQSYPSATRDELIDQLPSLRKRYNDYASYSLASTSSLINKDDVKKMKTLSAYTMESSYFTNDEGKFRRKSLPSVVQVAPIFGLDAFDVNHDGNLDILTGGNLHKMGARFGLATGNFGTVLLGDGHGGFTALSSKQSGITVRGEVRSIIHFDEKIIYIRNNDSPLLYRPR